MAGYLLGAHSVKRAEVWGKMVLEIKWKDHFIFTLFYFILFCFYCIFSITFALYPLSPPPPPFPLQSMSMRPFPFLLDPSNPIADSLFSVYESVSILLVSSVCSLDSIYE